MKITLFGLPKYVQETTACDVLCSGQNDKKYYKIYFSYIPNEVLYLKQVKIPRLAIISNLVIVMFETRFLKS